MKLHREKKGIIAISQLYMIFYDATYFNSRYIIMKVKHNGVTDLFNISTETDFTKDKSGCINISYCTGLMNNKLGEERAVASLQSKSRGYYLSSNQQTGAIEYR